MLKNTIAIAICFFVSITQAIDITNRSIFVPRPFTQDATLELALTN